jgi:FixJ family two-component response regulator
VTYPSPIVSIVDDDQLYLAAISRFLRAAGYAVKSFTSPHDFLAQAIDAPGCTIVDLQMQGLSGLDVQAALAARTHASPVIFLSGAGDVATTVRAMRHGAEDFLTKDAPKEQLLDAVNRALARDALQRAHRLQLQQLRERFAVLTPREHQVLRHVMRGQLNKQIAADLEITERTVKLHRTAITTKLGVRSVAELTRLVEEAHISEA